MIVQVTRAEIRFPPRRAEATGPFKAKLALQTTFLGLVMTFLGIALEVLGYLATAPWK
jgi:hypothetical protein